MEMGFYSYLSLSPLTAQGAIQPRRVRRRGEPSRPHAQAPASQWPHDLPRAHRPPRRPLVHDAPVPRESPTRINLHPTCIPFSGLSAPLSWEDRGPEVPAGREPSDMAAARHSRSLRATEERAGSPPSHKHQSSRNTGPHVPLHGPFLHGDRAGTPDAQLPPPGKHWATEMRP